MTIDQFAIAHFNENRHIWSREHNPEYVGWSIALRRQKPKLIVHVRYRGDMETMCVDLPSFTSNLPIGTKSI
jgi:hypothetical protein